MKPQTKSMFSTVSVTVLGYAVMELIHHGVIAAYATPWLISLGMSTSMAAYLSWALVFLGAALVGWLIWKFFVSAEE